MAILAIETSCDETAIAIIEFEYNERGLTRIKKSARINADKNQYNLASIRVLANIVSSQVELHKKFGGVVPNLARREHEANLVLVLIEALKRSKMLNVRKSDVQEPKIQYLGHRTSGAIKALISKQIPNSKFKILNSILEREPILLEHFKKEILPLEVPEIDAIAVTNGPGLAPALWVGVNFAKALSYIWRKPLIPVNHMEGHIFSALLKQSRKNNLPAKGGSASGGQFTIYNLQFPALALLVSGGHTELVLIKKLGHYKIVGETLDDAAGEAFDKVARILGLPYPGGPEIAILAKEAMNITTSQVLTDLRCPEIELPRPMLHSKDFNFSFSGLKTAVLYLVRDIQKNQYKDIRCPDAKKTILGTSDVIKNLLKSDFNRKFNRKMNKTQFSDTRCTEKENCNSSTSSGQAILDIGRRAAIAKEFQDAVVEVLVTKTIRAAKKFGARSIMLGGGVAANSLLRKELDVKCQVSGVKCLLPSLAITGDNALMIALTAAITGKHSKDFRRVSVKSNLRL